MHSWLPLALGTEPPHHNTIATHLSILKVVVLHEKLPSLTGRFGQLGFISTGAIHLSAIARRNFSAERGCLSRSALPAAVGFASEPLRRGVAPPFPALPTRVGAH